MRHMILAALMSAYARGVELQVIQHQVIHDERTYTRESTDRRYSIWTTDQEKAIRLLKDFGWTNPDFRLQKGQVLAVFLNDDITQDLAQIVYNKNATDTFADYAESGIQFKLKAPENGKKYTHVTALIFSPIGTPSHLGIRGTIRGGLSEKQ